MNASFIVAATLLGSAPSFSLPDTSVVDLPTPSNGVAYQLYVHVPPECGSTERPRCNVVYLLDAEYSFPLSALIVKFLSDRERIPALISVGIAYKDKEYFRNRTRDYTPFHYVPSGRDLQIVRAPQEVSGGGPAFLNVLRSDVIPYVEAHFPAAAQNRTLVGHSYGGLFATYAWIDAPEMFTNYIIVSPSLWYSNRRPLSDVRKVCAGNPFNEKTNLFLAVGELEERPESGRAMVTDLKEMDEVLKGCAARPASSDLRIFEDETHASVFPAALSTGLRKHFQ